MQQPSYPFTTPQFIGPQLRAARERAGLKQVELAQLIGVDPAMVSRWEFVYSTRYVPVPLRHVVALAHYLNVPVDDLVPGRREPPPPPRPRPRLVQPQPLPPAPPEPRAPPAVNHVRPAPAPGRPTELMDGSFRVRLRCPWCHHLNTGIAERPTNLPLECLKCGQRMRAQVTVTIQK